MKASFTHVPNLIKTRREQKLPKISQKTLSLKIGYKNGQFVSNIERGICSLPPEKILQVCSYIDVTPNELIDAMVDDFRLSIEKEIYGTIETAKEEKPKEVQPQEEIKSRVFPVRYFV